MKRKDEAIDRMKENNKGKWLTAGPDQSSLSSYCLAVTVSYEWAKQWSQKKRSCSCQHSFLEKRSVWAYRRERCSFRLLFFMIALFCPHITFSFLEKNGTLGHQDVIFQGLFDRIRRVSTLFSQEKADPVKALEDRASCPTVPIRHSWAWRPSSSIISY